MSDHLVPLTHQQLSTILDILGTQLDDDDDDLRDVTGLTQEEIDGARAAVETMTEMFRISEEQAKAPSSG